MACRWFSSVLVWFYQAPPQPTANPTEVDGLSEEGNGLHAKTETGSVRDEFPHSPARFWSYLGQLPPQQTADILEEPVQQKARKILHIDPDQNQAEPQRRGTLALQTTTPLLEGPPGRKAALGVTGGVKADGPGSKYFLDDPVQLSYDTGWKDIEGTTVEGIPLISNLIDKDLQEELMKPYDSMLHTVSQSVNIVKICKLDNQILKYSDGVPLIQLLNQVRMMGDLKDRSQKD